MWRLVATVLAVSTVGAATKLWPAASGDGQPGCRTRYEFTRLWSHNGDPALYYECAHLGRVASLRQCPPGTYFQHAWQTCVPKSAYEWTPPFNPPSSPHDNLDPCHLSVTECPPCEPPLRPTTTVCPPCDSDDNTDPGEVSVTECPPCYTTTLCPPCEEEDSESHVPFECNEDRVGVRWRDPNGNERVYWMCVWAVGAPTRMECPLGTIFHFERQACL